MRTQSICLALFIVLLFPTASAQWVQTNFSINGHVSCLAVNGTNLFVGLESGWYGNTGSGVFISTDNGKSWTAVSEGLPRASWESTQYAPIYCLEMCGQNLFAGTYFGVFVSTNNGTSWTAANEGLPREPSDSTRYLSIYCLGTSGTNLFAGTGYGSRFERFDGGVFLSTDNGTSWTPVNTGLRSPYVHALAVSGTNLIAACTWCFGDCLSDSLFVSTNSGTSWTAVNSSVVQPGYVTALAASGTNFFAGTDGGAFLSTDSGTSWTAANEGLPYRVFSDTTREYYGIGYFAASGMNLFASSNGIFHSTNNGTSWTAVNEGLPYYSMGGETTRYYPGISCFTVSGANLFAGGGSYDIPYGVWRRPLSEMTTDVESTRFLPTSFLLDQNYPNPFNPSTTIKYELPKSSGIRLSVFDMLGREVSVLVNEKKEAGVHEVKFDGSNLASGVYFYRLQAGEFVQTKTLVLLK